MSFLDRLMPPALAARLKKMAEPKASPTLSSRNAQSPQKRSIRKATKPATSVMAKAPIPSPTILPTFSGWRLVLCVAAFVLAGLGQWQWAFLQDPDSTLRGWVLFGAAALLLAVALHPWRAENSANDEIDPMVEKGLLIAILAIAAFFRIYRLDQMPPGIFIDQGIGGEISLRILKEHYRPIFADDVFRLLPYMLYQMAVWFAFFKATAFSLFLFTAVLSVVTIFFVYWTFKQWAGARAGLLAAYILSVMCWNVNFSRNGFPTMQVPFYMFGTLAFLQHGLRTGKRWAFVTAAFFCAGGMYTYQAYKIFPPLLLLWGFYEWRVGRTRLSENRRSLMVFGALTILLILPFFYVTFHNGSNIWREQNYNLVAQIKEEHSIKPAVTMVTRTAKMFNREGDSNERHNLPNRRMLDDITGALFVLGLAYAVTRLFQRQYFYAVTGFFAMSLPCLLSQDPAHANRMLGTTPFIALLAAFPLVALWDRLREKWGRIGELLLILILFEPLFLMAVQNYQFYFVSLANFNGLWTTGIWAGYSVPETRIGQSIARDGDQYDYFLTRRFYDYPSINFLAFDEKKIVHRLVMPENLAPLTVDGHRGIRFILMREHQGVLETLQKLYPRGTVSQERDLKGETIVRYFTIPQDSVQEARGVSGTVDGRPAHWPDFPKNVGGAHRFTIHGCLFIDKADHYSFRTGLPGVSWTVAGRPTGGPNALALARGFYAFEARWTGSRDNADPNLTLVDSSGRKVPLNASNTTTLPLSRGLRGYWYNASNETGKLERVEWNPIINFPHGGDFNAPYDPLFVRWEGLINAPQNGDYRFGAWTEEYTRLTLDGREVFSGQRNPSGNIHLTAGPHRLNFVYRKQLGPILSLLWKTPNGSTLQPIPMGAFGETQAGF